LFGETKLIQIEIDLYDIFTSKYKIIKNTNPADLNIYYDGVQKSFVIVSKKYRTALNCELPHTFYSGCRSKFAYYNFEIIINMRSSIEPRYYL
jgi:hypothetical protein